MSAALATRMKKMMMVMALCATACGGQEVSVSETESGVQGGTVYTPAAELEAVGQLVSGGKGCTATLISEFAILTASHCVANGASATFTFPNGRGSVTGTAIQHPKWNLSSLGWYSYDYAIVKLSQSIYTDPNVDSVGLVPMQVLERPLGYGESVYFYGYGKYGSSCGTAADGQVRVASVNITEINEDWNYDYVSSTTSLCSGDSGGPLVAYDNNTWKTAGVASFNDLSVNLSVHKPSYLAFDWIKENSGAPDNPQNTWGQCVYYKDGADGAYLSVQNLNYPTMPSGWDNTISSLWVKKGYKVTLYDGTNYSTVLTTNDGFNGNNCNDYGCFYTLGPSNNRASSAKCESALPTTTWGDCVYYKRFGGQYLSVQGDLPSFSGSYADLDNAVSHVWVKAGHTATLYPHANYEAASWNGKTYWESLTLRGDSGSICNAYGCLHDLAKTTGANSASSFRCN